MSNSASLLHKFQEMESQESNLHFSARSLCMSNGQKHSIGSESSRAKDSMQKAITGGRLRSCRQQECNATRQDHDSAGAVEMYTVYSPSSGFASASAICNLNRNTQLCKSIFKIGRR